MAVCRQDAVGMQILSSVPAASSVPTAYANADIDGRSRVVAVARRRCVPVRGRSDDTASQAHRQRDDSK